MERNLGYKTIQQRLLQKFNNKANTNSEIVINQCIKHRFT